MFVYIIRKYREESKLPLDLRSPLYNPKTITFWNYVRSEELIVDPEIFYLSHIPLNFESNIYTQDNKKYERIKNAPIGSLFAIIICSKNYIYSQDVIRPKFRVFMGYCVWVRPTVIQLRLKLVGVFFRMNFNYKAPNVFGVIPLTPKHRLRFYNKHSSLTYIVKDQLRRQQLSKKKKQR